MKKHITLSFLLFFFPFASIVVQAQDTSYVRSIITQLASPDLHGRGYVKKGEKKAAKLLKQEIEKIGLQAFEPGYTQEFSFPINTFPRNVSVSVDDKKLTPGVDYLLRGDAPSTRGTYQIAWINQKVVEHEDALVNMINNVDKDYFIAIDTTGIRNETILELIQFIRAENPTKASGIIWIHHGKLVYRPYKEQSKFPTLQMKPEALSPDAQEIKIKARARFYKKYTTQNLVAYHPGQVDTFIVMVAHYDHIGRMGKDCYFPGANDNASGSAALLDFARHIGQKENQAYYSYAFIWFGAEETGLLGSKFYTENPYFPLNQIKYLFNYDMVGTGDEGLSIVNALSHPEVFARMEAMNEQHQFFESVRGGKGSANSDHYYFTTHDVPSFFFFTRGKFKAYHDITDKAENLPLSGYHAFFGFIAQFLSEVEQLRY